MKHLILTAGLLVGLGAQASVDERYYEISNSFVREVPSNEVFRADMAIGAAACDDFNPNLIDQNGEPFVGPLDGVELFVDQVINIGKKIWAIVKAGEPVLNLKTSVATALPQNSRCWTDLQGWKMPESKIYEMVFENGFGSEVVTMGYRVLWLPGGSVDGQGKYVGYATVTPVSMSVSWGFSLDAEVTIPTVFNMGTKEAPLGGMQVNVISRIKSPITVIDEGQAFFLNGAGEFKKLD